MEKVNYSTVIARLEQEPFFKDFVYRKSLSTFVQEIKGGSRRIEFEHWSEFANIYFYICPTVTVRFNFINKWFEPFYHSNINDLRGSGIPVSQPRYKIGNECMFEGNGHNFNQVYSVFLRGLEECANKLFSEFNTPEDVYKAYVLPILEGKGWPDHGGVVWMFEYLTLCKVVAPENYNKLKEMMLDHAYWRKTGIVRNPYIVPPKPLYLPDLNIEFYYDRLDEILEYLESLSTEDLMKKRIKK